MVFGCAGDLGDFWWFWGVLGILGYFWAFKLGYWVFLGTFWVFWGILGIIWVSGEVCFLCCVFEFVDLGF